MTIRSLLSQLRPYWRVPVVAMIGGLLAFVGSYAFSPVYQSTTQVLIRGRDTTLLTTSTSEDDPMVDATLVLALGETQAGLVSSTEMAERIVDELSLDQLPDETTGVIGGAKDAVSGTVNRARAWVTHGYYEEPTAREEALGWVSEGLSAAPVEDSYIIEITGSADDGQLAADVTNTAADILVEISNERSQAEAVENRDFLAAQVDRAEGEVVSSIDAVRAFETENGILDLDMEVELTTASRDELENQLQQTEIQLSAAEAELAAIESSLASTSETGSNRSEIITGRSTTEIATSQQNPVFESMRIEEARVESTVASLRASRDALQAALDGDTANADGLRNEEKAQLEQLQLELTSSEGTYTALRAQYEDAIVVADRGTVELTRVDEAQPSQFPVRPLRYIYLALGLLCGAVAGAALTWLRREPLGDDTSGDHLAHPGDATPRGGAAGSNGRVLVGAGAHGNGNGNGNGGPRRETVGGFEVFRGDGTDDG